MLLNVAVFMILMIISVYLSVLVLTNLNPIFQTRFICSEKILLRWTFWGSGFLAKEKNDVIQPSSFNI